MRVNKENLDRAFNPRCVVVVGDKQATGYMWLRNMSTFKGKVYSVQIDKNELPGIAALGVENYLSLLDVPEQVDYVVCAVPRQASPKIVSDCIKKGIGGVTLFTSGFAETGEEEGIRLQKIVTDMAKEANLALIGPNCMGIYNPKLGVRHSVDQRFGDGGCVGFISQSGTHAAFFSQVGAVNGVLVSKSVSFGNAVVLDSSDYLEYLAEDEETKLIAMYIEGVKDGRRFFNILRQVAKKKPVLIWKGGQTEEGTRATASHTASMAESTVVWDAVMKQCGVTRTDNLEEIIDAIKGLLYIKPATGKRVGLIAMTGGQSVVITDAFAKAGLKVPLLSQQSYQELASFFTLIGGSYKNPLDVSSNFASVGQVLRMLNILNNDENVDAIVLELSIAFLARRWRHNPQFYDELLDAVTDFRNRSEKAFVGILIPGHMEREALDFRDRLLERGIPTFPSFDRGAKVLNKLTDYYQARRDMSP